MVTGNRKFRQVEKKSNGKKVKWKESHMTLFPRKKVKRKKSQTEKKSNGKKVKQKKSQLEKKSIKK